MAFGVGVAASLWLAIGAGLWIILSLYLAGSLYWAYAVLAHAIWYEPPDPVFNGADVQVRFLTIDNETVVRESVAMLPDALDDVVVVAERKMTVPGATVAVVPDEFECAATNKGRAIEWARREVSCDREFILYMDEDSHLTEFTGLPDADIVQLQERPRETNSWLTHLAEISRIGFQIEQQAFPKLEVPLYAWGGGIAIRRELEDAVTWNYPTIIEDTVFVWRAFAEQDASFALSSMHISNQSPPSLRAMFRQRRRWIAGAREDNNINSFDQIVMYGIRDLSWSVTALIPLLTVAAFMPAVDIIFVEYYQLVSVVLLVLMYVWVLIGIRLMGPPISRSIGVLMLAPIVTVLHSVGAIWGLIHPPTSFDVTQKVSSEENNADSTEGPQGMDTRQQQLTDDS